MKLSVVASGEHASPSFIPGIAAVEAAEVEDQKHGGIPGAGPAKAQEHGSDAMVFGDWSVAGRRK